MGSWYRLHSAYHTGKLSITKIFLQTVLRQESLSDWKAFGYSLQETSIFVRVYIVIMTFFFCVARFRAELELITALCLLSFSRQ